jgi:hypothetical protein
MCVGVRFRPAGGVPVGEEELMSFVLRQLELHKMVMKIVKKYVDEVLAEVFDIDPARLQREDPGTYFAIVMKCLAIAMNAVELAKFKLIYADYNVETSNR